VYDKQVVHEQPSSAKQSQTIIVGMGEVPKSPSGEVASSKVMANLLLLLCVGVIPSANG
jgi:hypothetical protein